MKLICDKPIELLQSIPVACLIVSQDSFWFNNLFKSIFDNYLSTVMTIFDVVDTLQSYNDSEFDLQLNSRHFKTNVFVAESSRIFFLKDHTEQIQLETIRTDFIANLAHELRTPLTSLRGALDTVCEYDTELLVQERQKFIQIARRHTNRICDIFENILLLSDIERGRAKLITEDIYVDKIISSAIEECLEQSNNKMIAINKIIEHSVKINANAPLLISALTNLISNAIKHSNECGKILVFCKANNSYIKIDVQDFGEGIPFDMQDRIFERFYRSDPGRDRHKGGSGLGLSLVKHIVKAHNGSIHVASKPGEGATFSIQLPL
jgi:two-component system phosphate regulon sensor histidine kinase PhoR